MCGIFGEFGEVLTPKNLFMDILKLSQERGPDMIGYFKDNNIQFGFNRLSILDITAKGNQRSRRVMEKLGMFTNEDENFLHPQLEHNHPLSEHVLYRFRNNK